MKWKKVGGVPRKSGATVAKADPTKMAQKSGMRPLSGRPTKIMKTRYEVPATSGSCETCCGVYEYGSTPSHGCQTTSIAASIPTSRKLFASSEMTEGSLTIASIEPWSS